MVKHIEKMSERELRADCKDKQRLIETQQQYLDNKDSVIKGMNEMIAELEAERDFAIDHRNTARDKVEEVLATNERLRAALKAHREVLGDLLTRFYTKVPPGILPQEKTATAAARILDDYR